MENLERLLDAAIARNATDLHICASDAPRIRVDNDLLPLENAEIPDMEAILGEIMGLVRAEERERLLKKFAALDDIDCAFSLPSGVRIRANIYRKEGGIGASFRIVPKQRMDVNDIGLPRAAVEICGRRNGLFIVSGANGSGKTTTLAAMIDLINSSRKLHILTIEDPVEHIIKSKLSLVSQREIGVHSGSFYSALRSSVRENPDLVVLGEMRDIETTRTALELAETGHLVFATLHTRTATSSIDRLIGQFPAEEQAQVRMSISESLLGVLSQALLKRSRGGLVSAFELLLATPAVRNLIREQKIPQIYSIMQMNQQIGMCTMEDSLLKLAESGIVTPLEAMAKSLNQEELRKRFNNSAKIRTVI